MSNMVSEIEKLWCDALKVEECDPSANFFDLGGNSLQIIKFLNALEESFGLEVEIEAIYDKLTLEEFTKVALDMSRNLDPAVG